jgi:hypothetical protein
VQRKGRIVGKGQTATVTGIRGDARQQTGEGMNMRTVQDALAKTAMAGAALAAGVAGFGRAAGASGNGAPGVTRTPSPWAPSPPRPVRSPPTSPPSFTARRPTSTTSTPRRDQRPQDQLQVRPRRRRQPTTFNQLASTLINQDHVFAVTGVATAFFTPNYFVEAKIPTYGYNVTGNWAGPQPLRRRWVGASTTRPKRPGGLRGQEDPRSRSPFWPTASPPRQ